MVRRDGINAINAPQRHHHQIVQLFGEGIELDRLRQHLETGLRQQPLSGRHHPHHVRIAAGTIPRAIKIGQEKLGGRAVAVTLQQISMGSSQPVGLPLA